MTPRAGRPEIGTPVNIRLGNDLLAQVDSCAKSEGISRAGVIRQLVQRGLPSSFTIEVAEDDSSVLLAVDADGNVMASAQHADNRWAISADDGLELPDAYVGDEAAARAWLDFIGNLHLS